MALAATAALIGALLPLGQGAAVRAASTVTGFYLDSVANDGIGSGTPELWPMVGWSVTITDGIGVLGITTTAFGPGTYKDMEFTAPAGEYLVPGGTYAGGMSITGCGSSDASEFTVHEIEQGVPRRLAISFRVECYEDRPVFGELRIDSAVPFRALTADTMSLAFATTPASVPGETKTLTIGSRGNEPLTIASVAFDRTGDDFTLVSETCTNAPVAAGGTCDVTVQFTPQNGGLRTAGLIIDDDTTRGTHVVALSGTGVGPASGIGWGSIAKAGPGYTFNRGGALGRTVQSGTQRLHLAYGTYRIGSSWAKDKGPYAGVYYTRSTSGTTWSTAKRLNSTSQHATRVGLAAAGSRVYVTWASQKSIRDVPDAARAVYVRVNTSHGASSSWKSAIRLTSTTGRVDYPAIAAYGTDVAIAWTDSVTGSIRVAVSRDRGVTWKKSTIGTTSVRNESGREGLPRVAMAGPVVVVAWRTDDAGLVKVRVSANRGVSWGTSAEVGSGAMDGDVSVAARGSRIAVAWITRTAIMTRVRVAGAWREPALITSLDGPETVGSARAPAVVLQDPARVAVAWAEEGQSGGSLVHWAESADGGSHWFETQSIATSASGRLFNDFASVVWPSASTRYVSWVGATGTSYRLFLRKGTGTPSMP